MDTKYLNSAIAEFAEKYFSDGAAPIKTVSKAKLSSRKLQEALAILGHRYHELLKAETAYLQAFRADVDSSIPLQLEYVGKFESFYQQVYVVLGALCNWLVYIWYPNGPGGKEIRNMNNFLEYLTKRPEVFANLLPLQQARYYRSTIIDHPQQSKMNDFIIQSFEDKMLPCYFEARHGEEERVLAPVSGRIINKGSNFIDIKEDVESSKVDEEDFFDIESTKKTFPFMKECYFPPHYGDVLISLEQFILKIVT